MTETDLMKQSDDLYTHYVKPLEAEYLGHYVAVSNDGRTILGVSLMEVADQAVDQLGPGSFVFKIGDQAIGKWR